MRCSSGALTARSTTRRARGSRGAAVVRSGLSMDIVSASLAGEVVVLAAQLNTSLTNYINERLFVQPGFQHCNIWAA
jgi:hypothetical protein